MELDAGRIVAVGSGPAPQARAVADLAGRWLVPGFVDLHVHGGGGASYVSGEAEQARQAAVFHRGHGTTTTLASLVTARIADLERAIGGLGELVDEGLLAGLHLEGPYLSVRRRGAHDASLLRKPDAGELGRLIEVGRGTVRMVTLAPELPGALEALRRAVDAGVVVAIGHTDATYAETSAAIEAGARVATHLFNGMRQMHHREPGPAMAALEDERVVLELINDGVHLHDAACRLAFAAAGPDRIALITDAIAAAGKGDGVYSLGSMTVRVERGVAMLEDGSSIAGSTLTMDAALRRAVRELGVPIGDAVRAAATTPARALGLDGRVGSVEPGKDADLVVLDDELSVVAVMRQGVWAGKPPM